MSELPGGWARVKLADLLKEGPTNGYSPLSTEGPVGTLSLKLSATTSGKMVLSADTTKRVAEELPDESKFWLEPGDLLVQRANTLEYVGTAALFDGPPKSYIYPDLMMRLRPYAEIADVRYLWRFFNSEGARSHLRARATGTAGNMPKINGTTVRDLPVPLPPLAEQRRIADKIEALTSRSSRAKEALDDVPGLLEDFRRSLLAAAFRGDLTAEWRKKTPDVEPADKLIERIRVERRKKWEEAELARMRAKAKVPSDDRWKEKYEEPEPVDTAGLPELPEGWCWLSLDHILSSIETGSSFACEERPPLENEVGVIKVSAVTWGSFDEQESKTCVDPARIAPETFVNEGDFLFSRANTLNLIGACVVVQNISKRLMLSDKILRFRFVDVDQDWVLTTLRSPWGRSEIERRSTGNQHSMKNIGQEHIRSIRVPLPALAEQREIARLINRALEKVSYLRKSVRAQRPELEALDHSILAKAFRGELVHQDPNDEPASVLLDLIRAERAEAAANALPEQRKKPAKRTAMIDRDMKEKIRTTILHLDADRFSFEQLRAKIGGDYDAVKEELFSLLEEPKPIVRQVFDKRAKAMQLERVRA